MGLLHTEHSEPARAASILKILVIQQLRANVWSTSGSGPGLPQEPHSVFFFFLEEQ